MAAAWSIFHVDIPPKGENFRAFGDTFIFHLKHLNRITYDKLFKAR
jgi:hypothetical protein